MFRPIVMFGLGGIFVEILEDMTFSAAPFDKAEARAMNEEITAVPILTGLRGQPPADLDALAAALSRLSLRHRRPVQVPARLKHRLHPEAKSAEVLRWK